MTMMIALTMLAAILVPARRADAQTSPRRIRGTLTDSSGTPIANGEVVAIASATGIRRTATADARGTFVLASLQPGEYEVQARSIGYAPEARRLRLLIGQTLDLNFMLAPTTVQLQDITVVSAPAVEMRTSEVATNITPAQIEALPSPSRNFLDLAALAPGVQVSEDRVNGGDKTFAAGALPSDNINVFVDGASYKNDVLSGGVAGQNASRGNPFPRNAVQEYRVLTNNFKAEDQEASGAVISAATKSGTNVWQGSVFTELQNEGFVAVDTFTRRDNATNTDFKKPNYSRYLSGGSIGGPIVRDKLFFFGSYEGNYQNRDGVTRFNCDPGTCPPAFEALQGETHTAPFRSNLFFGKLTYNMSQNQLLEINGNWRKETDKRGFGGQDTGPDVAFEAGESIRDNVINGGIKHTYFGQNWVNEAFVNYHWSQWNPQPFNFDLVGQQFNGIGRIGGRDSRQDIDQRRLSLRDDITFTGFEWNGQHVIKVGANYDALKYKLNMQLNENPLFFFDNRNNFAFPFQANFGFGDGDIKGSNGQLGLYAQDDWSPTRRLTLNLGVRWDYETGQYNQDFVTPQAVVDSLTAYQSAGLSFVNIDPARYFTDGTQRKAFTGAIQPRVGASFALDEAGSTVLFSGFGIFYDRIPYNSFIDESYRRQHPQYTFNFAATANGDTLAWDPSLMSREGLENVIASGKAPPQEVYLLPNDLKPPKSYQWNVGVRHDFGLWNGSIAYTGNRGRNGFTFEWANLSLDPVTHNCCVTHNLAAYQNVLVGNNSVRTWYDAMQIQLDRPYRKLGNFGWGAGINYTYSRAEREGNDLFSFPQVALQPRHPTPTDQPHRVVANWVLDIPYVFGIQFSGLATLGTGQVVDSVSNQGGRNVVLGQVRGKMYKRLDLRFRKNFPNFGGATLGVTADVFNVFNVQNLGCYNTQAIDGTGTADPNFGKANCIVSDPRKLQLGAQLDF
jgi:outer membrane receptor protein involved in Fe transport